MKRIKELFTRKPKYVLNMYCTAGFPELDSTLPVMQSLQEFGADIIELGMPYSDPLADGPVIQASGSRALQNGMTMDLLFSQLQNCRSLPNNKAITVPIILMGYMNPVIQYGFERFCSDAKKVGIDALILPDLPMYEFETGYSDIVSNYDLEFIFLVTPETSEERIRKLDQLSSGFLYAVSSSSTTGNDKKLMDRSPYFKKLAGMGLQNPVLVGFGISDRGSFLEAGEYSNGAIIGSAYIKALGQTNDISSTTRAFLGSILTDTD